MLQLRVSFFGYLHRLALMVRVINFHNLDTSNEGKRLVLFGVVDITKSLPGTHMTVTEQLRNLLDAPVNRKSRTCKE